MPILAVRTGTDQIKWVEAYDDHTLVFFHKEPLATNTWNMNFPVIPKAHLRKIDCGRSDDGTQRASHASSKINPVVGGPYELVSRVRNQEFVVRRRESYYMHNGKQVRDKAVLQRSPLQSHRGLATPRCWP